MFYFLTFLLSVLGKKNPKSNRIEQWSIEHYPIDWSPDRQQKIIKGRYQSNTSMTDRSPNKNQVQTLHGPFDRLDTSFVLSIIISGLYIKHFLPRSEKLFFSHGLQISRYHYHFYHFYHFFIILLRFEFTLGWYDLN